MFVINRPDDFRKEESSVQVHIAVGKNADAPRLMDEREWICQISGYTCHRQRCTVKN